MAGRWMFDPADLGLTEIPDIELPPLHAPGKPAESSAGLIDEEQAARMMRVTVAKLRSWASGRRHFGPIRVRFRDGWYYDQAAVKEWCKTYR
jgi:hypothetical protein